MNSLVVKLVMDVAELLIFLNVIAAGSAGASSSPSGLTYCQTCRAFTCSWIIRYQACQLAVVFRIIAVHEAVGANAELDDAIGSCVDELFYQIMSKQSCIKMV